MKAKRYTQEERTSYCENWRRSGLGCDEYCERTGLKIRTFRLWLKKYREEQVKLVPVKIKRSNCEKKKKMLVQKVEPKKFKLEAKLPGGIELFFAEGIEADWMLELLRGMSLCK